MQGSGKCPVSCHYCKPCACPLKLSVDSNELMEIYEVEFYISTIIFTLPVSNTKLNVIVKTQANDHVCSTLMSDYHDG